MATRFYLRNTTQTTNITPTADAAWEDTSALVRAWARTNKSGDTITTVNFTDNDATDRDVLFRQYISLPLTPGQTITGSQAVQFVVRGSEVATGNNLFTAMGIRVINGSTVQKTVLAVTRDNTELTTTLTNRNLTATSAATNYTTVLGDYLVIEIGYGGDPTGSNDHDGSLSLGDSSATDLTANDTGTAADNPWVEIADTLTFQTFTGGGGGTAGGAATTSKVGASVTYTYSGSGGGTSGGSATTLKARIFSYSGSGGGTAGGAATTLKTRTFTYSGTGGGTSGGSATTTSLKVRSYSGSGGGTAGGSATTSRLITRSYSGTGGGTAGGTATTSKSATGSYTGSGGATAGGSATISRIVIKLYSGSGGGVAGGSAVYEKYITYIIASIAFELAMLNAEATVTAEQLRAKVKITEEKIIGSGTAGGAYVNYIS